MFLRDWCSRRSSPAADAEIGRLVCGVSRMYDMDHLLTMLTIEKARELHFRAGSAPVIVSDSEERPLQGPPITNDDVFQLLRSIATSRQMRDLRERGMVHFVYTRRGRSPFVVRATMKDANVAFSVS